MDTSVIPKGDYCYDDNGLCPYWRNRKDVDNKETDEYDYGYCLFLGKGDIELNKEYKLTIKSPETHPDYGVTKTADEFGISASLLWDQVKECFENMDEDEECNIE